ncbi:hypothetical protein EDD21DRAFT_369995 [Dissophora ornata]|nr:hypothetical protein BGZ58_006391 [Dissophora ornata]KAI8603121.1 hypothetical protein EDD21DRAFT_369995 [Dissophora ornata]
MAFAGSVNPLDIPEILLRVGQFIPLWSPKDPISSVGYVKYSFQPRDLLAAIAVNRTFHRTLTPLLWVVCTDYIVLLDIIDILEGCCSPPLELLLSCSHHFRFLEIGFRSIGNDIRFQCTHLQELRLSKCVDRDVGADLISANKGLTLLSWDFPILASGTMQEKEYVALGGLKKLRVLQLRSWTVDLDRALAAVLAPNAAVLEELSLSDIRGLDSSQARAISVTNTCSTSAVDTTTLPKLRTLLLECDWNLVNSGIDNEVLEVIRICPNLETLIIQPDHTCDTEKIGRYLRDHCPKLSAVRCVDGHMSFQRAVTMDDEGYVALIQGCVPPSSSKFSSTVNTTRPEGQGLRVFEMGLGWLDSTITSALMAHSDCLETLILFIRGDEAENFYNARQLLGQCRHLRKFGMYNYLLAWSPDDGMLLLKDPWACRGLKSLTLEGFVSRIEEERYDEQEQDNNQELGYVSAERHAEEGEWMRQDLEALDHNSEVVDENVYNNDQISGCDSPEQDLMGDTGAEATIDMARYQRKAILSLHAEIILGNWYLSGAHRFASDYLLSRQGYEFKRKLFHVANSLSSLENVSLNDIAYVRGAAHNSASASASASTAHRASPTVFRA